jgi:ubiquinone/menaquinone biosynthesis C-methylase UbiE
MIKLLGHDDEISYCKNYLEENKLPVHRGRYKNWDMCHLNNFINDLPRDIKILDSGCWGLNTAKLLKHKGFNNIIGIDLYEQEDHLKDDLIKNKELGIALVKGDTESTNFQDNAFDLIVSISVIEHGINFKRFLSESKRILKSGGYLFVTCDYWEDKIITNDFNWNILDRESVTNFIYTALGEGFKLVQNTELGRCVDKVIKWNGQEYTFLMLIFKS